MRSRRSVRSFRPDPVPREKLLQVLNAAHWAPSAGNCQPWELVVVERPEVRRRLADAALEQSFIADAPLVIVVCANTLRSVTRYGERGRRFYCLLDAAAATQNLLLATHALGLGACWIGAFDDAEVAACIGLPSWIRAVAIVPIGFPDEHPSRTGRMALEQVLHYDRYGGQA